jgi:hypothetical protein
VPARSSPQTSTSRLFSTVVRAQPTALARRGCGRCRAASRLSPGARCPGVQGNAIGARDGGHPAPQSRRGGAAEGKRGNSVGRDNCPSGVLLLTLAERHSSGAAASSQLHIAFPDGQRIGLLCGYSQVAARRPRGRKSEVIRHRDAGDVAGPVDPGLLAAKSIQEVSIQEIHVHLDPQSRLRRHL